MLTGMDVERIQRLLWPLLVCFVMLGFGDMLTTLLAFSAARQFAELNLFASTLFGLGLPGFLVADLTKYLPVLPLLYIAGLQTDGSKLDFQVSLLKLTALVVLVVADAYLGWILLGNNLPNLVRLVLR